MEPLDRETAQKLFHHYRKNRDGIRNKVELESICLICGSIHIIPDDCEPGKVRCRNCGFSWYRYQCLSCGKTVDARDPKNPVCLECGRRFCTCGNCGCTSAT